MRQLDERMWFKRCHSSAVCSSCFHGELAFKLFHAVSECSSVLAGQYGQGVAAPRWFRWKAFAKWSRSPLIDQSVPNNPFARGVPALVCSGVPTLNSLPVWSEEGQTPPQSARNDHESCTFPSCHPRTLKARQFSHSPALPKSEAVAPRCSWETGTTAESPFRCSDVLPPSRMSSANNVLAQEPSLRPSSGRRARRRDPLQS